MFCHLRRLVEESQAADVTRSIRLQTLKKRLIEEFDSMAPEIVAQYKWQKLSPERLSLKRFCSGYQVFDHDGQQARLYIGDGKVDGELNA